MKNKNKKFLSVWWVAFQKKIIKDQFKEEDSINTFEKEPPTALKDTENIVVHNNQLITRTLNQ